MNIITFDIEDYFHLLELPKTSNVSNWDNYTSRVEEVTLEILNLLKIQNIKATFFILGWIAKKNKKLVSRIYNEGHDIGTHSFYHKLIKDMSIIEFKRDFKDSVNSLEDIIGSKVKYYRAPGFSFNFDQKYVIDTMKDNQIEIDSSVFPGKRAHGGIPNINCSKPFYIKYNGHLIKEYPIRNSNILGKQICFTGGGYFRLFNIFFIEQAVKRNDYNMFYFHPRDLDKKQPKIKIHNLLRRFRTYVGINNSKNKFKKLIKNNKFYSISQFDKYFNWSEAEIKNI